MVSGRRMNDPLTLVEKPKSYVSPLKCKVPFIKLYSYDKRKTENISEGLSYKVWVIRCLS